MPSISAQSSLPLDIAALLPAESQVISAQSADLTGIGSTEWVIFYQIPTGLFTMNARVAIAARDSSGWFIARTVGIDGAFVPEIELVPVAGVTAVALLAGVGAHGTRLIIVRWDGTSFAVVFDRGSNTAVGMADIDGDGTPEVLDHWSPYCGSYAQSPVVVTVYRWDGSRFTEDFGPYPLDVVTGTLTYIRDVIRNASGWEASARACLYGALGYMLDRSGDVDGGADACLQARQIDSSWEDPVLCGRFILSPEQKVRLFYALIDQQRFYEAWWELSRGFQAQHPFAAWQGGYARTLRVAVEYALQVEQSPPVVEVSVIATDLIDGRLVRQRFAGTWTLALEDGVWKLDQGHIRLAP